MGGKSSAPEAPDPKETSAAQTGTNVATAIANAVLQNPQQTTPYGTLTYNFDDTVTPTIEPVYMSTTAPTSADAAASPFDLGGVGSGKPGADESGSQELQGYNVGGRHFTTYEDAVAYQQTLPQGGGYQFTDPYTGETYTIPTISVEQQLTPEGQQLLDQNVQTQLNLSELAQNQSGFLTDYMSDPFSYDAGQHEDWALGLYDQLNADSNASQEQTIATNLANQGIMPGSDAFESAMGSFYDSRNDARNSFALDSYGMGMQTALTNRNQPINEIIGLLSGSQVQQPNFVNSNIGGIATTDNAGLINNAYQQELNAWSQDQANAQGMLGGLFNLGGTLGSAWIMSDRRTKTDIEQVGQIGPLPVYTFRYIGGDQEQVGFMADEVERVAPDAVMRDGNGIAHVNYAKALEAVA